MKVLYSENDMPLLAARLKRLRAAAAVCAVLTAAAVGTLLALTEQRNEQTMRFCGCVTGVLGGWACLFFLRRAIACRRLRKHCAAMLAGETVSVSGTAVREEKKQHLTSGVAFFPVRVETPEGVKRLCLCADRAAGFPGGRVKLTAVHGFITGWEAEA